MREDLRQAGCRSRRDRLERQGSGSQERPTWTSDSPFIREGEQRHHQSAEQSEPGCIWSFLIKKQ